MKTKKEARDKPLQSMTDEELKEAKAQNLKELKRLGAIENAFKEFGKAVHEMIGVHTNYNDFLFSLGEKHELLEKILKNLNYKQEGKNGRHERAG